MYYPVHVIIIIGNIYACTHVVFFWQSTTYQNSGVDARHNFDGWHRQNMSPMGLGDPNLEAGVNGGGGGGGIVGSGVVSAAVRVRNGRASDGDVDIQHFSKRDGENLYTTFLPFSPKYGIQNLKYFIHAKCL
ncbi:hypothetical protein ACJX0J_005857, partial [Zea mays]